MDNAPPSLSKPFEPAALAALLDDVAEPLLWLDAGGALRWHNTAAERLPGGLDWLRAAFAAGAADATAPRTLADGRVVRAVARPLAGGHALRLQTLAAPGDALALLWSSPFPAVLQDARLRIVDANDALLAATGFERSALIGRDPVELGSPDDRDDSTALRAGMLATLASGQAAVPPLQRRIIDATGRERWFLLAAQNIAAAGAEPLWLTLLHDQSAEHQARDQARRSQDELARWFELARTGMLVYDEAGLIVRSNPAFEALVQQVPMLLADAASDIRSLLGWTDAGPRADLQPGAAPVESQALVRLPDGRARLLSARLAAWDSEDGQRRKRRVMAVVEDRSAEEERDLAQLEIGMLMDTASVGVATYDPARGWLESSRAAPAPQRSGSGLQGIGRELVDPGSLPDYERLQRALRLGERTEVRYAVRHPELGLRWLLTRVEPGALAGGRTTSVVTLDVTEQETAQRRNEQLLRELTTILDGSTAGIAYLRGTLLVRCNRRFERMLGFAPGAAAGASLEEAFGSRIQGQRVLEGASAALAAGRPFEAELRVGQTDGGQVWYSLSVRRADAAVGEMEAVAVLTDISHLKSQQAELETLLRERELMFSLSDVGIVYLRGARIERANQAMARLTGYAAPELTLLDPAELYDSARECVAFEAQISAALRSHGRFSGERRLRRRDAGLIWVQVAVRQVDPGDESAGVICSFVDIDERRRARESLAVQAERTRAILNSVLVGIVTVSDSGIEWMNRSARRMFGGELADFVGAPISIVATPESLHPLRRTDWLQRLTDGQAETFECRLQGRDGREFWVVGNAVVTGGGPGSDGSGRQLTFALLDIERRRQAEISIARAEASLKRVIETAPLAIALFDARSLRVLQLNQMASTFFGRPLEHVLGAALDACCSAAKAATLRDWFAAATGADVRRHELHEDAGERASPVVWDVRIVPLAAAGDEAAQLLLVASDVTEQRAAEQARLQAAIAQREVLVREVHHRIKNNLQGVAGLLQQNAARHPEVAATLAEAVGQVQAIAQVYGLQVGASGPLRVARVVEAIAQSVQRTFGRAIAFAGGDGADGWLLPEAEAIPVALTVNELLTNAVKHAAGDGDVRCSVAVDDGAVVVDIRNPGLLGSGFDLARVPGGVSGLGLVRALLPRRSSTLAIEQRGGEVLARVALRQPSVRAVE